MSLSAPSSSVEDAEGQKVRRCITMKKPEFDVGGRQMLHDLHTLFGWTHIRNVRTGLRYDVEGLTEDEFNAAKPTVLAELPTDLPLSQLEFERVSKNRCILVEPLPGQYDQAADSAEQCVELQTKRKPNIRVSHVITIDGEMTDAQVALFKKHLINPTDSREANAALPETLKQKLPEPPDVRVVENFASFDKKALKKEFNCDLAMTPEDLEEVKKYFARKGRAPTVTELRVIDTYWSDHCRHTTFTTEITCVSIDGIKLMENGKALKNGHKKLASPSQKAVMHAFGQFLVDREEAYTKAYGQEGKNREMSLMDLALFSMRQAKINGGLVDMEDSEENNAASVVVPVTFEDGHTEMWLMMFKNETHNHPSEIEGFGGAATCLGGCIRDPLSGRAYAFMAMRLTGGGDPREPIDQTMEGKLPQRIIAQKTLAGHASYGDQIGIPAKTHSVYHEGYKAKRWETGYVGGAVKLDNVRRERPSPGDVVILLGGRTGRDGIGGASGSSKEHTAESIETCGAEVQKGNPPEERKIQRLFRNPEASRRIPRCNDFGAGGVAVAIGELADGLDIDLDAVRKKYEGLDGTEIAISESQERMAVVLNPADVDEFMRLADEENLEATIVSRVKEEKTLTMTWRGQTICDIDRDFLNNGWAKRETSVNMQTPEDVDIFFSEVPADIKGNTLRDQWVSNLQRINVASERSQQEHFDSTVGAGTVSGPFEGSTQSAPSEAFIVRFPAADTDTSMAAAMGYDPDLSEKSPFHGGMYAIVDSAARLVAAGADPEHIKLTLQNYFEKLGNEPDRWGKVFLAQLGAREAQKYLNMPAIGGKDSMSGSFTTKDGKRLDVPPTLASFAVSLMDGKDAVPACFQKSDSTIVYLEAPQDEASMPVWETMLDQWKKINELQRDKKILSSHAIHVGGAAAAISQMCFGNNIGANVTESLGKDTFTPKYGSMLVEIPSGVDADTLFKGLPHRILGKTTGNSFLSVRTPEDRVSHMPLGLLREEWEKPLDSVFPRNPSDQYENTQIEREAYTIRQGKPSHHSPIAQPHASVFAFPGTNCELETARAFERYGAVADVPVFANLTSKHIERSIRRFAESIRKSQILALPGGFSAGDQPGGSAKFIASVLRNKELMDAVHDLIDRGGLVLGICNGFQGLVKSCLLPGGRIGIQESGSVTLAHNNNGHFTSKMAMHKVTSVRSPWMAEFAPGELFDIPMAHGEGKLVNLTEDLWQNGQIPFQYADRNGRLGMDHKANPNGSEWAAAALTDVTGRIFGMMAHPERALKGLLKSIPGERKGDKIFRAGVNYFR